MNSKATKRGLQARKKALYHIDSDELVTASLTAMFILYVTCEQSTGTPYRVNVGSMA